MRLAVLAAATIACSSPSKPATPVAPAPASEPAAPPLPVAPALPPPDKLTADTPRLTALGNTYVGPAGWTVEIRDAMNLLTPPEGDGHIALVDVRGAKDGDDALAKAWAMYKPNPPWKLLVANDGPDKDGWSKQKAYAYQTSPSEKRVVAAKVALANDAWTVWILDLPEAIVEKRGAQLNVVLGQLLPKGRERETFVGKTAHELDAARLEAMKQFVATAQEKLKVPGVAFGFIQKGKVVWAGGSGVREVGKPAKVDADTLFMIASNTKALSTLMLAKLVDTKQITWDQAVTSILPTFKLGSDEVTKQVLVKHLVCACTGLPRQDMEFLLEWKDNTPEKSMATLATMQPTSKFGELFQYSNLLASAGGYVGGHVAFPKLGLGPAYDKAMQTLVFDPLGMKATTFDFARALRGNHATPYGLTIDGAVGPAPMKENYSVIPVRPAGAAWSNVTDMLKYIAMELAAGKLPNGKIYIGSEALLARRAPQVAIGKTATYGMGLMVDTKYGVPVVHHGGDVFGFHSEMYWLPDSDTGAVILTNGELGPVLRGQFQRKLLEVLFDGNPEADAAIDAAAKSELTELAAQRKLLAVPADAAAVAKLAKRYKSDALGQIAVTSTKLATVFDFGEFGSQMATKANPDGSVSFVTIEPALVGLEFVPGEANGKHTLVLRDAQHEYVFTEL